MPQHPHNVRVSLASLTASSFPFEFVDSLTAMQIYDRESGHEHLTKGCYHLLKAGPRIAEARNQLVDSFAQVKTEWLLMLDSDMSWQPDLVERLLDAAYEGKDRPVRRIIGGLCFAGLPDSNKLKPTIYRPTQDPDTGIVTVENVYDYPRDALVKVQATGAACLMVHTSVFARMQKPHPEGFGTLPNGEKNSYPWFIEGVNGGKQFGEDIAFCMRANALGIDVWVDTSIKVGHVKTITMDEAMYDRARARRDKLVPNLHGS